MRYVFLTALVLIAAVLGLGFYLEWFKVWTKPGSPDGQKVTLGLEVDKARIQEDTQAAQRRAQEFGAAVRKSLSALAGAETVKGKVVKVEETDQRFTLTTADNKELTIQVDPSSKLRLNDTEVQTKDLQAGDRVTVVYQVKDGNNIAQSVTIERGG
jgi:hypothetical protein